MENKNKKQLYALRGHKVLRPATEEEIATTQPLYLSGKADANGKKKGFFMIHGFTVTPANFYGYAQSLSQKGFAIALPQLPGHATEPADMIGIKWQDWLSFLREELKKFKSQVDEVYIAGISLGGALALHLAKEDKQIKKLFLLAPAVYPVTMLQIAMFTIVPTMCLFNIPYWFHVAGDVKDQNQFEIGYKKTPVSGMRQLFECMMATQKILGDVTTETVIFQGETDHEVPAEKAQSVFDKLGTAANKKELIWLKNSYHEIPRDPDAQFVLEQIMQRA